MASPALLCMPTRLDGAGKQDESLIPNHVAAQSSSLTGSLEGIASAKPPLGMQTTAQVLESKSSFQQGAPVQDPEEESLKGNLNASDPVQETPNNRNKGAQTRREMPKVHMVEIPDEEDDTSFQQWWKADLTSSVVPEVTQLMVARPSGSGVKTEKVPSEWLKPFSAEWMLHRIVEAQMESEAKAI